MTHLIMQNLLQMATELDKIRVLCILWTRVHIEQVHSTFPKHISHMKKERKQHFRYQKKLSADLENNMKRELRGTFSNALKLFCGNQILNQSYFIRESWFYSKNKNKNERRSLEKMQPKWIFLFCSLPIFVSLFLTY